MALHEILYGLDISNLPHLCHLYIKYPNQLQGQASRSLCNLISSARGEQRTLTSTETGRIHCAASHLFHVYIVLSVNILVVLRNVESVKTKIDSSKANGQNQPKTWQLLHSPGRPG